MVRRGVFVCIEGLDGCGKTTQARLLVRRLKIERDAVYTAEPSSGRIGQFVKKYCLHAEKRGNVAVEALLFAADRVDHLKNEIVPALEKGKIVVSDRYVYSSLAYQGAAGLDLEWIKKLNSHAIPADLAIFLDVKPETVVQRLKAKKSVMENLETQRRVQEIYARFVAKGELVRIDGNRSKKEVADALMIAVRSFLRQAQA